MNLYHVCCFIKEHPPTENDAAVWFKRVCGMFKNRIPSSLVTYIEELAVNNHVLAHDYNAYRARIEQRKLNKKAEYDAYIIRRNTGNARARAKTIAIQDDIVI
jgi:hypothetical protein